MGVQTGMDVVGMVPVVGEVFDIANAAIHTGRGHYDEAALSMAASVPVLGTVVTGAKIAYKATAQATEAVVDRIVKEVSPDKAKVTKVADEVSSGTQTLTKKKTADLTNPEFIQEVANRAEKAIEKQGRVAGIHKHTYSKDVIDKYQDLYGQRGLKTEVSYWDGFYETYGKGSVRLDVVDVTGGSFKSPAAVYDYKFGKAGLTETRVDQIKDVAGFEKNVPIIEVRPQL